MIEITIETDNDAYAGGDARDFELARNLRILAMHIERYGEPVPGEPIAIIDSNGQTTGRCVAPFDRNGSPV